MVNFTNIHFPGLLSQFIDISTKFWCVEKNNIKCGMCSVTQLCPTLCDPWTPLSMEFSRQGYWSGLPFPAPGDLLHPGIELGSPALQADSLLTQLQEKP